MGSFHLILTSVRYHWRTNVAVAAGVAAAAAVLTGALLVGDSMRGSLRHLTLDRLGRVDSVLVVDRFFRTALADELAAAPEFDRHFDRAVAAILLTASLENADPKIDRRANQVNVIGCGPAFWQLGSGGPQRPIGPREIVLNRPTADRLGVEPGDAVLLRLPQPGTIPSETVLGRRSETVRSVRLTVAEIIEAEALGRFALRPSQQQPRNAYVAIETLQSQLERPEEANAILVGAKGDRQEKGTGPFSRNGPEGASQKRVPSPFFVPDGAEMLQSWLQPTAADYGLHVERAPQGYLNITTDRLLFSESAEAAIRDALGARGKKGTGTFCPKGPAGAAHKRSQSPFSHQSPFSLQPTLTYLANTIARGEQEISYSTITAIDFPAEPPLGPFVTPEGEPIEPLADDQIVLNSWAADDLEAKPGDRIRVDYFDWSNADGTLREHSAEFRLVAIAALEDAAADRRFTPEVPGVTSELSMADWDPPFPFDATRIRDKDEDYWDEHGPTPKAFVSLAAGRRLWASRFGRTSSIRLAPAEGLDVDGVRKRLALPPASMGFVFQPVKQRGLEASSGATPFSVLFLAFSFFIIGAAVLLIALLFRLGIEQRAEQLGILAAVGFRRRQILALLGGEGLAVALAGSLVGMPLGVGYAALMLLGLRTWWVDAIGTPFLQLYITSSSLLIGFLSGVVVAMAAIAWTVWRSRRVPPQRLLAGEMSEASIRVGKAAWQPILAAVLLVSAVLFSLAAGLFGENIQAGAFFGAGALVLAAAMTGLWARLRSGSTGAAVAPGGGNTLRLALRNAARNPGRSTLSVGLIATACFLIVAVSAFQLDPTARRPRFDSGNGGFALVAESTQPIHESLDTRSGRRKLGFSPEQSQLLDKASVFGLRVSAGDDASCLNLYQTRQPRVLGLPEALLRRGGFAWADSAATTAAERENPWLLLNEKRGRDSFLQSTLRAVPGKEPRPLFSDGSPTVPVVLDQNTAMYALHLYDGVGATYTITDGRGRPLRLKVVGLLSGNILQGDLLISEEAFLRHFPEVGGRRMFLVECPSEQTGAIANALETALGDYGLATETTGRRLARFLAVQNTYLSTFRSLGGLGLLLGTLGLGAVQLRNVLQRRRELALMQATGFRRRHLAVLVVLENALLLTIGLGTGVVAALVAVMPHMFGRGATVPWLPLAATLALVLLVGLAAGAVAVRAVLTAPLLAALHEER